MFISYVINPPTEKDDAQGALKPPSSLLLCQPWHSCLAPAGLVLNPAAGALEREEIQGCKAAALLGTQESALMVQHKGTFIHHFGFSHPKVIPRLQPRPLTVDLSAVMLRLYQHPCHLLPRTLSSRLLHLQRCVGV